MTNFYAVEQFFVVYLMFGGQKTIFVL